MVINDIFQGISTLIYSAQTDKRIQGTGFYYNVLSKKNNNGWREVEKVWLVTNRHVLLPQVNGKEIVPDNFVFHLRKLVDSRLSWEAIVLDKNELLKRAKLHNRVGIDIAM